ASRSASSPFTWQPEPSLNLLCATEPDEGVEWVQAERSSTVRPMPEPNEHLPSATPSPPSEQSSAESTRPAPISSTTAFCNAATFSTASAGGNPQSSSRTDFAYSDEPNSISASVTSPGSEPRSNTTERPASRK